MELPAVEPWRVYGLSCAALFAKMFGVALVQGVTRVKHRAFVRPDDAAFFGRGVTPAAAEHPLVDRAQSALRNDGENIPIFLFLSIAYIQLGCPSSQLVIYMPLFVIARYLHTLFYLRPTQPFRNWSYVTGQLLMMIMVGHIIAQAV